MSDLAQPRSQPERIQTLANSLSAKAETAIRKLEFHTPLEALQTVEVGARECLRHLRKLQRDVSIRVELIESALESVNSSRVNVDAFEVGAAEEAANLLATMLFFGIQTNAWVKLTPWRQAVAEVQQTLKDVRTNGPVKFGNRCYLCAVLAICEKQNLLTNSGRWFPSEVNPDCLVQILGQSLPPAVLRERSYHVAEVVQGVLLGFNQMPVSWKDMLSAEVEDFLPRKEIRRLLDDHPKFWEECFNQLTSLWKPLHEFPHPQIRLQRLLKCAQSLITELSDFCERDWLVEVQWEVAQARKLLKGTSDRGGTGQGEGAGAGPPLGAAGQPEEKAGASDERRYLTVSQAASASGCDRGLISRAVDAGSLKSNGEQGRKRRIDAADLACWQLRRAQKKETAETDEAVERKLKRARGE